MLRIAIFGAQSIALGTYRAIQKLYKDFETVGFLVSSKMGNPDVLAGIPVYELKKFQEKTVCILVATPEDAQESIIEMLEEQGFHNHICMNSEKESVLMEKYYTQMGMFRSLHDLGQEDQISRVR